MDITYANHQLLCKGKEMEDLIEKGASYLPKISNHALLDLAKQKTQCFGFVNDENGICNYLQQLTVNGKKEFFYSNKLILNQHLYFNVSVFVEDLGIVGQLFKIVFEPVKNQESVLLKFQLLTKQEKRIVKLLIHGHSYQQIAELLFISIHTLRTHMKNIHKKMETDKTSHLVRMGLLLDII
ncbi:helix-turn-helix transcriptional regulator [Ulvibacterium sp.]|uniref:helix-turn-helix transcriptional regulator n=1 Tax=Ulvibacterium sp. TaxID=2665914 RepID=UPI003BA8BF26